MTRLEWSLVESRSSRVFNVINSFTGALTHSHHVSLPKCVAKYCSCLSGPVFCFLRVGDESSRRYHHDYNWQLPLPARLCPAFLSGIKEDLGRHCCATTRGQSTERDGQRMLTGFMGHKTHLAPLARASCALDDNRSISDRDFVAFLCSNLGGQRRLCAE